LASRYFDLFDHKIDVARFGGDEFVILLNDLTQPEDAATVATRIKCWVTEPVKLGDRLAQVGVTIGIAVYPMDGEDSGTLIKNADIAMYHAKKMGKGHYRFFDQAMALRAQKRLEIETQMYNALSNNELRLHYQPIIDTEFGHLMGAEALLRWDNPELGFLPSDDFVPLAEENGMIILFGEWVIRDACRQHKAWEQQGLGRLDIAVNVSGLQFNQPVFVQMITQILQEYDIPPSFLTLELTESMIMDDTDNTLIKLATLKKIGVKLSIDDFGTGYSSLRYLNRFPLDILKIDRSFVQGLPENQDASAIVNAILALAKTLNLKTVAEGVETSQQMTFLRNTTCDAVQGYYYSKPLPGDIFEKYWAQQS
jgi:predicted signal transduction protein with EAL and GGDEF domain